MYKLIIAALLFTSVALAQNETDTLNHTKPNPGFKLEQNYPNPFKKETAIEYHIPQQANVKLVVYDLTGREVKTLVDDTHEPGDYKVYWDGYDRYNRRANPGRYMLRLETKEQVLMRTIMMESQER